MNHRSMVNEILEEGRNFLGEGGMPQKCIRVQEIVSSKDFGFLSAEEGVRRISDS